ncbi:MAG: EAL domain-containing protein [Oscillospiraceae bacterium]
MTYFITKVNTESDIEKEMSTSLNSVTLVVNDYMKSAEYTVNIAARDRDIKNFMLSPSDRELKQYASDSIQDLFSAGNGPDVIWCAAEFDGTVLTSDGRVFASDLESKEWYNDLFLGNGGKCRFYLNNSASGFSENGAQILAVVPVMNEGDVIGYVGAELFDTVLKDNIKYKTDQSSGVYPVVCDKYNNIVCAPENESGFSALFAGTSKTVEAIVSADWIEGQQYSFENEKQTNYFAGSSVDSSGWNVVVFFDGKELSGSFNRFFWQQIIILACLFVLELIATLNVIRHESKDIPEISSSIAEISAGNYNFRINSDSDNEIGLIAKSVDKLAQTLQDKNAVIDDYTNLDPTTGLQNRYRMYETINDLIISRDETRKHFALLFIDIDNFKWITETLGHRQGDEFLRIFGQRLKTALPRVYRFSGDEFVALVEYNDDISVIDELIHKLKLDFLNPIEILNDKLYATFSVGVSIYPDDDTNADMLLRDADIAMSRAKEKGKDRVSYFNNSLHKKVLNKATIAQKLNKALENNEMFLNFQPIISVSNGDIHGFEVLLRWESDELGYVSPANFVNIAEETGAMVPIGTWIFETACRYLRQMNEYNPDIIMSVNVSPVQMKAKDFIEKFERVIQITNVNPKNIQIEITESVFVDIMDSKNNDIINKLNDMGMAIALDDFGTGYSSLNYLKTFPIKTLKVDKSFVDEICSKRKDYQITESIIDMVRNLGIKTVVEGVETIEQYNILSEMKCDYIQGFLMSKPLSESDAMEFVIKYDELHKPNKQSLEKNSHMLAMERLEREREKVRQMADKHLPATE